MIDLSKAEKEKDAYREQGRKYSRLILRFNKIEYHGLENIVEDQPGIIAPNHVGSAKDILTLFNIFDTKDIQLFYAARRDMFVMDEWYGLVKKHLRKHLGIVSKLIPDKAVRRFAEETPSKLARIGTIPFDIKNGIGFRSSMRTVERYLSEYGRKVVLFQYDEEKRRADKKALFHGANKGAAFAVNRAYQKSGLVVPVYPTAIIGSHGLMPECICVNIGKPLEINYFYEHIAGENPIDTMTHALDVRIKDLLDELKNEKKDGKIIYPGRPR